MVPNVILASVIACYLYVSFLWKQCAFYLSLSVSVISTSPVQLCCKKYTSLSFACPINENDQKQSCRLLGFGFKSCGFLVLWRIVILSIFRNKISIWIKNILLNFFATSSSILGLQVVVLIRVSQIRWDCLLCLFNVEPFLWPAKQVCSWDDRSPFFWLLLLFLRKWLQLLFLLRSSLEICTPTPVYTPKVWKQSLFCHIR